MDGFILPERLQVVRSKLSKADLILLAQEILDEMVPAAYADGVADGKEELAEAIAAERASHRKRGFTRPHSSSFVYFIKSQAAIKIGVSYNPKKRLKAIQTGHADRLELIAWCGGDETVEREYHRRFAAHRLHGEWFSPHPDILAEITRLQESPNHV